MKASSARKAEEGGRLDASDWIEAALERLGTHGIDGVRIEILAKALGVTKGSFYYHFKDRDALHASMLDRWRRAATMNLIERLDRGDYAPEERLRRLIHLPIVGRKSPQAASIELAIRLWGRQEDRARRALQEVDDLRLSYIGRLLESCGVPADEIRPRSVLAYSYMRVAATLMDAGEEHVMRMCDEILLGAGPGAR